MYLTPSTGQQRKTFSHIAENANMALKQVKEQMFHGVATLPLKAHLLMILFTLLTGPWRNLQPSGWTCTTKHDAEHLPGCACKCIPQGGRWMCKNVQLTCQCHWHTWLFQECEFQRCRITTSLKLSSANKKQREPRMALARVTSGKWSPMSFFQTDLDHSPTNRP